MILIAIVAVAMITLSLIVAYAGLVVASEADDDE